MLPALQARALPNARVGVVGAGGRLQRRARLSRDRRVDARQVLHELPRGARRFRGRRREESERDVYELTQVFREKLARGVCPICLTGFRIQELEFVSDMKGRRDAVVVSRAVVTCEQGHEFRLGSSLDRLGLKELQRLAAEIATTAKRLDE